MKIMRTRTIIMYFRYYISLMFRNEINSPLQERKIQNEQIVKMEDSTSNKVAMKMYIY